MELNWKGIDPRNCLFYINHYYFLNVSDSLIVFNISDGEEDGPVVYFQPSGIVAEVETSERICAKKGEIEFYEEYINPNEEFMEWLKKITEAMPDLIVIGTELQAHAYPRLIFYTTPANKNEKPPVDPRHKLSKKLMMYSKV